MTQTCQHCKFFSPDSNAYGYRQPGGHQRLGECRFHAPVAFPVLLVGISSFSREYIDPRWPVTGEHQSCGQFQEATLAS